MTRPHRVAFLKVLAAVAWADGVVQADERNRIKMLFHGFGLPEEDLKAVNALLERPVGQDEAVELTKEFAAGFAGPGDRKRLIAEIEAMLGDEEHHTEGERELLEHVRAILQSHTVVDGLMEKLRGVFSSKLLGRDEADGASREERDRKFLRAVLDDRPARDIELQKICAAYCRDATMEDRLRVLDAMFRQAAEDQVITKREGDHIYRVANLLWISNPEYHEVRDRYRDRIEA
ncbi:TerB family tellurite resistance protein [bacterium]|nr:TerB family tellurite resistance protein [bacterium]